MRSKTILNLILLGVIASLGVIAYLEPGKKPEVTEPLAKLDANQITEITLKNKETIVFQKKEGVWRLTEPFPAPVNQIRINQLVDIASSQSLVHDPIKPDEYARFDLVNPLATLTLGGKTLNFGGVDPINLRRYVRIDDTLHLVNDDFFHRLNAIATDFVDKRLLPEGAKVNEISVPGVKVSLNDDGKWSDNNGKQDYAEWALIWATSRAIDVKRLSGNSTGEVIHIGLLGRDPIDFTIIKREGGLILGRTDLGLQFELTSETAKSLLMAPLRQVLSKDSSPPSLDEERQDPTEIPPDLEAVEGEESSSHPTEEEQEPGRDDDTE